MNHLREFIEALHSKNATINKKIHDVTCVEILNTINNCANESMCFSVGNMMQFIGMMPIIGSFDTPSQVCWYEGVSPDELGGERIVAIFTVHHNGSFAQINIQRYKGEWIICNAFSSASSKTGYIFPIEDRKDIDDMLVLRNVIVSSMRCTNVKRIENKPPEKLQRARAKRGKLPLFSYWTLQLKPNTDTASTHVGSSHNSPRLHIRRGHIREYKTGKYIWVNEHLVGRGDLGYVHKDYQFQTG